MIGLGGCFYETTWFEYFIDVLLSRVSLDFAILFFITFISDQNHRHIFPLCSPSPLSDCSHDVACDCWSWVVLRQWVVFRVDRDWDSWIPSVSKRKTSKQEADVNVKDCSFWRLTRVQAEGRKGNGRVVGQRRIRSLMNEWREIPDHEDNPCSYPAGGRTHAGSLASKLYHDLEWETELTLDLFNQMVYGNQLVQTLPQCHTVSRPREPCQTVSPK